MPLGSNLARPRRLIVSIDLLWEKSSKIFFSETTGHTALIFCMWQWLMVIYINCASHAPGVKFGHAPGVDSLIHVIPPSSSGRLQEMSHKIYQNSSKIYLFSYKIQNLPEMDQEVSYIFYTFFKNLPEMEEKSP